jgi:hypothetical protein
MIDATALRKQAANKYPEVVEALLRGENPFPIKLRYARVKTTDSRESILRDIATLKAESREHLGFGLTIAWAEINTVKYSRNSVPHDISLETEADFLGYVGKRDEMRTIRIAAEVLMRAFPNLLIQLPGLWRLLRDGSREYWEQVVRVVSFFRDSPVPDRYIRELPVEVHTKFIGENRVVLERVIEAVAPHALRPDGETFEERLGLKTPDALIECRLLDDALLLGWRFRQFTVGLKDLNHLGELPAHTILITENRTNFLTLPLTKGTIAFQGQGYAVSRLRRAPFLKTKRIIYWGDLDAQGFEILAVLRRVFPQTESLMMDTATWTRFPGYRVNGVKSRNSAEQFLPFLSHEEVELFGMIASADKRLEQERLPQDYANSRIAQKMAEMGIQVGALGQSSP